jgi:hypothetical protein
MRNQTAATTLAELIVELTSKGIECNFRSRPHERGLVVRFSIDGRDIFTRFDYSLIDAYRGTVDGFVVRDLRRSADRLLDAHAAEKDERPIDDLAAD